MNKEKLSYIYNKINFILEFVLSIMLVIMMFKTIYIKNNYGYYPKMNVILCGILAIFLGSIMIINIIKHKNKIEKMFLNFMIPIGIAYLVFIMPTYVPDEQAHVYRAYDIGARGNIFSKLEEGEYKTLIPEQMEKSMKGFVNNYNELVAKKNEVANYEDLSRVYNVPRGYFPILYIFSAVVFLIGKLITINPIIIMYLARIPNYIMFLILGYYSIKKIPFGKLLVLTYLFTPMSIQQAVSVSADSLSNSVIIFFIAYTLFLAYKSDKIKTSQKCIYYLLAFIVGIAKIAYFPISTLSLLLLQNKKESKKNIWIMIIITVVIATISSIGWYLYSMKYPSETPYIQENNINSLEQIKYIVRKSN